MRILNLSGNQPPTDKKPTFWNTLTEQIIDSIIVGGIAGLSVYATAPDATFRAGAIAFWLTFLLKLKEYRKL